MHGIFIAAAPWPAPDDRRCRSRLEAGRRCTVALAMLILVLGEAAAPAQQARDELFPGFNNPRLQFHTGRVAFNRPEMFAALPDIPGDASPWQVVQWRKHEILMPAAMLRDDAATRDPLLGIAPYAFRAPGGESEVDIFRTHAGFVYQLAARDGWLDEAGGSNLFLQAEAATRDATFDKAIAYAVDLKLASANASATDSSALRDGSVLAQVITGFSLRFRDPQGGPGTSVFLQIPHADSRRVPPAYQGCSVQNGRRVIVDNGMLPQQAVLPFRASDEPPRHAVFDLNLLLCDLLARPILCRDADGAETRFSFPASAWEFGRWSLRSMFIGLETEAMDLRSSSHRRGVRGHVEVAVQIGNLTVTRDRTAAFTGSMCPRE